MMTLPRIVASSNRLDLRKDRYAGLTSFLVELGYTNCSPFLNTLEDVISRKNFSSYLHLPYYINRPSISTTVTVFRYVLELIDRSQMLELVAQSGQGRSNSLTRVLDMLTTIDFTNYTQILDYFAFPHIKPILFVQEPERYIDWLDEALPELTPFSRALKEQDILTLVEYVVYSQVGYPIVMSSAKRAELRYWTRISYSTTVLGSDYNQ